MRALRWLAPLLFTAMCSAQLVVPPVTAECATSVDGSVVLVPNPLSPPQISAVFSGTLPPGTYYTEIAWYDAASHVTLVSPEVQTQLSGTGELQISPPASGVPGSALGMQVFIGASSGTETFQGSTSGSAVYTQSVPLVTGTAVPTSNNTVCQVVANDAGWPTGTGYNVSLTTPAGETLPGYPMQWQLLGPGSTINLSSGLPLYNGSVNYPAPILAIPYGHGPQSISGPLSLGAYSLTAGSIIVGSINTHTEYAADYGLGDCGQNINAAAAFFTNAGLTGTIVVDSGCGTAQWSATTIPTGVTLDMTAGGTYAINTITFSNGAGFRGPPTAMLDGVNEYPALILRPNVSSGAAFLVSGSQVSIQNFGVLDGLNSSATGAGIAVTGDRFSLQNGNVLRFAGDGIQITSTGTSNQAAAMKMSQVMVLDNGGNAVNCTNTTDLFATNSEFENSTTGWGILETNCSTFRVEHSDISGNFLGGVSISGLSNAGVLNGGFNQYIGNDFSNNKGPDVKINGWDSVHSGPSSATNVFSANVHAGANGADNSYCAYNLVDTTNNVVTSNPILSITSHRFSYGICESFVSNTPSANIFNSNAIGGLVGTGAWSFSSTAITSNNSAFATGFSLLQNQYIGNFNGSGAGGLLCQNASGTIELCFGLDSVNILEVRGDPTGARIDLKPDGTTLAIRVTPTGFLLDGQTNTFSSGAGVPSGNCTVGSLYTNASASSASTVLYVCYPANTWAAVTVP